MSDITEKMITDRILAFFGLARASVLKASEEEAKWNHRKFLRVDGFLAHFLMRPEDSPDDAREYILSERKILRDALSKIKNECGTVCTEFEVCNHPACNSSFAAWMIASEALEYGTSRDDE
jgi:hypothetical protein